MIVRERNRMRQKKQRERKIEKERVYEWGKKCIKLERKREIR